MVKIYQIPVNILRKIKDGARLLRGVDDKIPAAYTDHENGSFELTFQTTDKMSKTYFFGARDYSIKWLKEGDISGDIYRSNDLTVGEALKYSTQEIINSYLAQNKKV